MASPSAPPTEPAEERSRRADDQRARLRARAAADGFLAWDEFMDVALYAPGSGYYARARSPFGPAGDFYTAGHVHPLFARTLAREIGARLATLGRTGPVVIAEIGPGDGALAAGVLEALAERPDARPVEYRLIERSSPLARAALERAAAVGERVGVPVRSIASVGQDGPFRGIVLANELADALPARRLRWEGSEWVELGVRFDGARFVPAEHPLVRPVPAPPLPDRPEPGTIVELSSPAESLLREVADHLVAGRFLLIDYGMGEAELVAGHPRGTLAAVRQHRTVDDPFQAPGETDLSVFVNFDRLRAAARGAGWTEAAYRSQAEALGAWGFADLLAEAIRAARSSEEAVRLQLAAKNLLFGFDRFRVLELEATPPPGPDPASSAAAR